MSLAVAPDATVCRESLPGYTLPALGLPPLTAGKALNHPSFNALLNQETGFTSGLSMR